MVQISALARVFRVLQLNSASPITNNVSQLHLLPRHVWRVRTERPCIDVLLKWSSFSARFRIRRSNIILFSHKSYIVLLPTFTFPSTLSSPKVGRHITAPNPRPPGFPDLTPLDFFLSVVCVCVCVCVHTGQVDNAEELYITLHHCNRCFCLTRDPEACLVWNVSWDILDNIVSDPDRTTGFLSPAEAKNFSCILCVQTSSEALPVSYPMGTGCRFPWGKARPGSDADLSPPPTTDVKNE
jgi:hypothetical protein